MAAITESVDVHVSPEEAYDRWTRFEEFPRFMEGVREVRRREDGTLHWRADVGGREEEWDARVVAAEEGRRVAWDSVDGLDNGGDVRFEPVDGGTTRVTVNMRYAPQGLMERAGDALGITSRRVRGDLERFRDLVESEAGTGREATAAGMAPAAVAAGTDGADTSQASMPPPPPPGATPAAMPPPPTPGTADGTEERAETWWDVASDEPADVGPEGYPEATRLPSLSRLRGADVYDLHGERIGSVSDVYLDSDAQYVRYIEVKTGWGARGRGLVPVDAVSVEQEGAKHPYIRVPYARDQIRMAPGLDDGDELTPDREEAIYRHYERTGYWDAARRAIEARQNVPAPTPTIAEAEVIDAVRRGQDPESVRVKRWGV